MKVLVEVSSDHSHVAHPELVLHLLPTNQTQSATLSSYHIFKNQQVHFLPEFSQRRSFCEQNHVVSGPKLHTWHWPMEV